MARRAPQPGLDNRYRDEDGTTHKKRGDTLVKTLRRTYGSGFAEGIRSDARLDTVLDRAGVSTLDQYLRQSRQGRR
jgi:hypothetical protein